jgi:hypothetical protein
LVDQYIGGTAVKTQKKVDEAKEGILFLDEAYRLKGEGKDFGVEALETIMAAMNEPPGKAPVMIFAGYPREMQQFMNLNAGMYRRIHYTFTFDDYTPTDLAEILQLMVIKTG